LGGWSGVYIYIYICIYLNLENLLICGGGGWVGYVKFIGGFVVKYEAWDSKVVFVWEYVH